MRSSSNGGSAVASLSHRRAITELRGDELYMGINIPEVERSPTQVASLFFPHNDDIHALAASHLRRKEPLLFTAR